MKKRTLGLIIVVLLLIFAASWTYVNRQFVKDKFVVLTTELTPESAALEQKIDLTSNGDFLYRASQTELQKAADFKQSCSGIEKQAVVLGCYSKQQVYVYDITDTKLEGVREVTAAHELLHAAYERLSPSKKDEVNAMLRAQAKKITDKNVVNTLALYKELSSNDLLNEMHSIFGTEVKTLSPGLERYYQDYFTDRQKVVAYSDEYQAVFAKLQNKAKALKSQLEVKNELKIGYESQLSSLKAKIDAKQSELSGLKLKDVAAYNAEVAGFNQMVNNYNSLVAQYKQLVSEMNQIISEINGNITEQNSLTKKLDSNYSQY